MEKYSERQNNQSRLRKKEKIRTDLHKINCLNNLKSSPTESPSIDGLPGEFYQRFKAVIIPILHKLLQKTGE